MILDQINQRLADLYGKQLDGKPNFRIIWSEDQFEKRKGDFSDFYGDIYLRTERTVREVRKYPLNRFRYILERLQFNPHPDEIFDKLQSYEPVFVFESMDRQTAKSPNWRAVNLLVHQLLYGNYTGKRIKITDETEEMKKEDQAEASWMYEYLNDQFPDKVSAIHHGEGIVVPSSYGDVK